MSGIPHPMTDQERTVIFKLCGNDLERCLPIVFTLCGLPFRRKGAVFLFMIEHGITGKELFEFSEARKHNPHRIYKTIVDRIDGLMKRPMLRKDLM